MASRPRRGIRLAPSTEITERPPIEAAAYTSGDVSDRVLQGWLPHRGSADSDLIPELGTIVPRARDLDRNNGIASSGHQTLRDNIIGHQLRLSSKPHYRLLGWTREQADEWGNHNESEFETWANTPECDATQSHNLLGLTLQGLTGAMLNGDAVAVPVWAPRRGARWNTRIQLIDSDRLGTPPHMSHRGDIRGGRQIDAFGAPVGYWIQKTHPGDHYGLHAGGMNDYEFVPAFTSTGLQRVIHLYDAERTGQNRGKPIITTVMKQFRLAGKYADTHLETAVAQSLIAAFLESDLSPDAATALFGRSPSKKWEEELGKVQRGLTGSAVIPLPAGARMSAFNPSSPNPAFGAFMESALRHIAAGLNLPYELLLKDFSKTNYSSARAALLEAWRYFLGRRAWIKHYWLRPIYELWMEEAVTAGRLPGVSHADYLSNRYAYARCRWVFAGRGWVDPVKEANAAQIRMAAGISTLEDECAEQGTDWRENVDQRALERETLRSKGLLDQADAGVKAAQEAPDVEEPDDAKREETA